MKLKKIPEEIIVYKNNDLLDLYAIVFPDGAVYSCTLDGKETYICQYINFKPDKTDLIIKQIPVTVYNTIQKLMS